MKGITKEEQEKIIASFKNIMADRCELQDDILTISEESIDKISSDIVNKFHCFSTKEASNNFLFLILSFIRIRPLKIPLYGKLLFKISKYLAPLTSEQELMKLFSQNKLIILNLLEANLITIDTIIKYQETDHKFTYYFCNEIRSNDPVYFGDLIMKYDKLEEFVLSITPEKHDKKRRIGLNDGEFETMIRENKIPSIHPNNKIEYSLYENSEFLTNISYAEYAAFFGSINSLKHFLTFSDIKTARLLDFAIAGNQTDTVNFLINQTTQKIQISHENILTSIEFQTTKDIEISANIKENDTFSIENQAGINNSSSHIKNKSQKKPISYEGENMFFSVKIKGKQINDNQKIEGTKKFINIADLVFSIKKLNWIYFVDNLLFASDQINDPIDGDEEKSSILHFACSSGNKEVIKLLLSLFGDKNYFENDENFNFIHSSDSRKSLIDVNNQDKFKRSPLHLAVFNQKVEIIKILFKCDDTIFGMQDFKGKTPAHYSAETKNLEIVQLFIESSPNHVIDLSIPDKKGNTVFHYFCKPRCFEPSILKYVCESSRINPNHLNHKNMTEVMHSIIKKNRIKILQILADSNRVDLNIQTPGRNETALMMATQRNNIEAVKILMKDVNRIDPNLQDFRFRTALHIAVHYGSYKVFELIINQPKVNMNIIDDFELNPVFSALYKHRFRFFDLMLVSYKERKMSNDEKYSQNNIDLEHRDHFSQNLLHYAVRCQYMPNLDFLLKIYSINEPDSKGTNAFHQACAMGCVNLVEFLVKQLGTTADEEENNSAGLYNSSMDDNGISAIEFEEKKIIDDLKIARYKPGEKIRINQKDSNGLTPFHYACQSDSIKLVEFLISLPDIKIDEKDDKGETPFFYACRNGYFEIAKILLKTKKIDQYSKNFNDVSALSWLSEQNQKNIFL